MVDVLPGHQRSFFFHSFHGGVKVQGALVQAQKLSDAFSAVQVAVLVYHLHNDRREGGSRGQRRAAEVRSEDSDAAGEIRNTFKRGDLLETTHLFCGAKLMCVHG